MLNINGTLFRSSVVYFDFLNSVKQDPYTAINSEISWRTDDEKVSVLDLGDEFDQ